MSKPEKIIPLIQKKSIEALLEKGERLDGRSPTAYRSVRITVNAIERAEGSAIAEIGNTMVIAGVKMSLGSPFPDTPDKGVLIVNAELIPIASPTFEPGPPGEEDVEISRVVDRGIRSSEMVDLSKLAIIPGKKVWVIYVDIYALNHDGNLFDACMLAATSALLTTQKPKTVVENNEVKLLEEKEPLPIKTRPVSVTFAKIGSYMVVDPSYKEELAMDARLTLSFSENGDIVAVQKGLPGYFSYDEIMQALEIGEKISRDIRKHLPPIPTSASND
ncbi:MAG: RNA-binding protein [Thermoprotei archaeon]|nr:MAG: RNA-binding protein [Thermoprotei archaeon]